MKQQDQIDRLTTAREKAAELQAEKSRLEGELSGLQKRRTELSTKCKTEFGCEIDALDGLIKQLHQEAEVALQTAEKILGLREGEPEPVEDEPVDDGASGQDRESYVPEDEDEDGLV